MGMVVDERGDRGGGGERGPLDSGQGRPGIGVNMEDKV